MDYHSFLHHRIIKNEYDEILNHIFLLRFHLQHMNEQNIDQKHPFNKNTKYIKLLIEKKKIVPFE